MNGSSEREVISRRYADNETAMDFSGFTSHFSLPKAAFTLAEGATHVAHCNNLRKVAFTLAEILITLAIIGVVAAITLPTFINKYQEHVLKQQFKRAYSNFSQVLLQVQAQDFDMSVPNCYYAAEDNVNVQGVIGGDCLKVRDGILKRLKVIKTCSNKAYENGCIPDYKGYDTMSIEQNPDLSEDDAIYIVRALSGFYKSVIHNQSPAYDFADGTIVFEYNPAWNSSYFPCLFAIDINGKKGPNKWGYDLFSFFTVSDGNTYKLLPTGYAVDKGGKTSQQMIRDMFK